MFFLCIQQLLWEVGCHSWCNKEGGKRDSKMTILSLLNLFLQFWSAIWSVSLKMYNPSTLPFLLCLFLQSPTSFISASETLQEYGVPLGCSCWETPMSGPLDYVTEQLIFLWSCLVSLMVPDDSISLIFYWSFSLSLINANLLGSTSEVKSELACRFLELFNRS